MSLCCRGAPWPFAFKLPRGKAHLFGATDLAGCHRRAASAEHQEPFDGRCGPECLRWADQSYRAPMMQQPMREAGTADGEDRSLRGAVTEDAGGFFEHGVGETV